MGIIKLEQEELATQRTDLLINIIYNNFLDLSNDPKLNHNIESITKILESPDVVLLLFMDKGKIGGYLLAEIIHLEDGRKVMFISYIFVAKYLRTHGVGSQLLNYIKKVANVKYCDGLMLIYDTSQKKLRRFYDKHGFLLDFNLRRYETHDVFYLVL
jgi:ribosomal protein S18 acetylase RimI-like enzyme